MRNSHPPEQPTRFGGNLRHYHRAGTPTQKTWNDWVNGGEAKPPATRKWGKRAAVVFGALALVAIAVGLFVELG